MSFLNKINFMGNFAPTKPMPRPAGEMSVKAPKENIYGGQAIGGVTNNNPFGISMPTSVGFVPDENGVPISQGTSGVGCMGDPRDNIKGQKLCICG